MFFRRIGEKQNIIFGDISTTVRFLKLQLYPRLSFQKNVVLHVFINKVRI